MLAELPTSMPVDLESFRLSLNDPFVRKIVAGAAFFVLVVILLRIWRWRREAAAHIRRVSEISRSRHDDVRLQPEEIEKLAKDIRTTSSTARVTGFTIVRQVEAVFTDGRASSAAALELCKALAAQKGGNAIVNVQTKQGANGKWFASGDAVVVKQLGRRGPQKG